MDLGEEESSSELKWFAEMKADEDGATERTGHRDRDEALLPAILSIFSSLGELVISLGFRFVTATESGDDFWDPGQD